MARTQREASHASLDEVCEAFDELGAENDTPLLLKYDDVILDVESIVRTESGAVLIVLQEA